MIKIIYREIINSLWTGGEKVFERTVAMKLVASLLSILVIPHEEK